MMYHQSTPPEYPLSHFSVPLAVFHGTSDLLSNPQDVQWLLESSGLDTRRLLLKEKVFEGWGHNTYFLGEDASYLQNDVVPLVKKMLAKELFSREVLEEAVEENC